MTCDVIMDDPMKREWRDRTSIFSDSMENMDEKSIAADELKSFCNYNLLFYTISI